MVDEELEARLASLGQLLGEECTLVEPPQRNEATQETLMEAEEGQAGREDLEDAAPLGKPSLQSPDEIHPVEIGNPAEVAKNDNSATTADEQKKDDAPRKFLNHDAGPRASTSAAFDNSKYIIGQPVEENIEFCPWQVVSYYPNNYVGKTNRPHVSCSKSVPSRLPLRVSSVSMIPERLQAY